MELLTSESAALAQRVAEYEKRETIRQINCGLNGDMECQELRDLRAKLLAAERDGRRWKEAAEGAAVAAIHAAHQLGDLLPQRFLDFVHQYTDSLPADKDPQFIELIDAALDAQEAP